MQRKSLLQLIIFCFIFGLSATSFALSSTQITPVTYTPNGSAQIVIGQGISTTWMGDCTGNPGYYTYYACTAGSCGTATSNCSATLNCSAHGGTVTSECYLFCSGICPHCADDTYEYTYTAPPACGSNPCVSIGGMAANNNGYNSGTSGTCFMMPTATCTNSPQPPCPYIANSACSSSCSLINGSQQCSKFTAQTCTSCTPGSGNWCQLGTTQSLCPSGKNPFVVASLTNASSSSTTCSIASSTSASTLTQATVSSSGSYYNVQVQAQIKSTGGSCPNLAAQFDWMVLCQ